MVPLPDEHKSTCFQFREMIEINGETRPFDSDAFAIAVDGDIYVYKNRCPHAGSPLDWLPGQFFSDDGKQLVCHTHDARFDPVNGDCLSGPCPHGLEKLPYQLIDHALQVPQVLRVCK